MLNTDDFQINPIAFGLTVAKRFFVSLQPISPHNSMQPIREIYKMGFGPSSSHTIGPVRAAEIFMERHPDTHSFRVTLFGSISLTSKGHHTDHALQKAFMPNNLDII